MNCEKFGIFSQKFAYNTTTHFGYSNLLDTRSKYENTLRNLHTSFGRHTRIRSTESRLDVIRSLIL